MSSSAHRYYRGVNWRELPLFRLSIPFIAGILFYTPALFEWVALVVICVLVATKHIRHPAILRYRVTIATWTVAFALGNVVHACADRQYDPYDIARQNACDACVGIVHISEPYSRGTRATLRLQYGLLADSAYRISGRVLAYLQHPEDSTGPVPGDTIVFLGAPDTIPAIRNPFQWDPAGYYGTQQIHHRLFLHQDAYTVRSGSGFRYDRISHTMRMDMQAHLRSLIADTTALAVLNAMLLGDKSLVSDDLRTAYVRSGIIHILAISGLHIGIVAALLIILIGRPRTGQAIGASLARALVILAGIWGFTLISGMSPSATRAALMCTIATIGITWQRRSSPLNILGCSAIVVLVIDPYTVYSISFQFSYLALTGILVFATPLFRLVTVRSRIVRYVWGIVGVSVAAQIPIAPAMLYYFGEMSTLSPLTSVVAIPAAFLIVSGGITVMALAYLLPGVATTLADLLTGIVHALNTFAISASGLSFSAVQAHIDRVVLTCLYIFVGCLVMRFLTDNKRWTVFSLLPACLTLVCYVHGFINTMATPALVILPGQVPQIEYYHRGICQSSIDTTALSSFDITALRRARSMHLISDVRTDTCPANKSLISADLHKKRLRVISSTPRDSSDTLKRGANHILYIASIPDSAVLANYLASGPQQVVIAAHLWPRQREAILQMCAERQFLCHDMKSHGAFYTTFDR